MLDKAKANSCLILSAIGWIMFIAVAIYMISPPYRDEFSKLAEDAILGISAITAVVIHIINCILGFVFVLQQTEYRKLCLSGLLASIIFMMCFAALCIFVFWEN